MYTGMDRTIHLDGVLLGNRRSAAAGRARAERAGRPLQLVRQLRTGRGDLRVAARASRKRRGERCRHRGRLDRGRAGRSATPAFPATASRRASARESPGDARPTRRQPGGEMDKAHLCAHMVKHFAGSGRRLRRDDAREFLAELRRVCERELLEVGQFTVPDLAKLLVQKGRSGRPSSDRSTGRARTEMANTERSSGHPPAATLEAPCSRVRQTAQAPRTDRPPSRRRVAIRNGARLRDTLPTIRSWVPHHGVGDEPIGSGGATHLLRPRQRAGFPEPA